MDEHREKALRAEIAAAIRKREQLEVVIAYLSEQLGMAVPAKEEEQPARQTGGSEIRDPSSVVNDAEFYGYGSPKAARVVLERVGRSRPLKTSEILAAIQK